MKRLSEFAEKLKSENTDFIEIDEFVGGVLNNFDVFDFAQCKDEFPEILMNYFCGYAAFVLEQYEKALDFFFEVPEKTDLYSFAQYNRAICHQKLNQEEAFVMCLEDIKSNELAFQEAQLKLVEYYNSIPETDKVLSISKELLNESEILNEICLAVIPILKEKNATELVFQYLQRANEPTLQMQQYLQEFKLEIETALDYSYEDFFGVPYNIVKTSDVYEINNTRKLEPSLARRIVLQKDERSVDPNEKNFWRAYLSLLLEKEIKCLEQLEEIEEDFYGIPTIYLLLALTYFQQDRIDEGLAILSEYPIDSEGNEYAQAMLLEHYFRKKDFEMIQEIIHKFPPDTLFENQIHYYQGRLLVKKKRLSLARRSLTSIPRSSQYFQRAQFVLTQDVYEPIELNENVPMYDVADEISLKDLVEDDNDAREDLKHTLKYYLNKFDKNYERVVRKEGKIF